MGLGRGGDPLNARNIAAAARIRTRSRVQGDAGVSLMETVIGSFVAMIAFALAGSVLVGAQRQERIADSSARTVDTARLALDGVVDELREARVVRTDGSDARAWYDHDRDGLEDTGEVVHYGFRADGDALRFVREVDGETGVLVTGLESGSVTTRLTATGSMLVVSVTVPGSEGRTGTTLMSEVMTRGNL